MKKKLLIASLALGLALATNTAHAGFLDAFFPSQNVGDGTGINTLDPWIVSTGAIKAKSATNGLWVPGLATSTTGCLSVASNGWISPSGSACGSGSGGSSFSTTSAAYWYSFVQNWSLSGGTLAPTTTTVGINIQSSTSTIRNLSVVNSTTTNATSTNFFSTFASTTNLRANNATATSLYVTNSPSALLLTSSTGLVGVYGGASACTNQAVTAISASGGTTCATITNSFLTNSSVTITAGANLSGGGAVSLGSSVTLNGPYPDLVKVAGNLNAVTGSTTPLGVIFAGSSSLPYLSVIYGTTTNATSTTLFSTYASTTNLFANVGTSTFFGVTGAFNQSGTATSTLAGGLKVSGGGITDSQITNCDTVDTDSNGNFKCGTDATGGAGSATDFTYSLNYNVITAATSSNPIWSQAGIFASSTSHFVNADFTSATTTNFFSTFGSTTNEWFNFATGTRLYTDLASSSKLWATTATTTNLGVTALTGALVLSGSGGNLYNYSAPSACSNQFLRAISSVGAFTCASVANADLTNSSVTVTAGNNMSGGGAVALGSSITLNSAYPDWAKVSGNLNAITPTTTQAIIISAATSTFIGISIGNSTTTNATTTSLYVSSIATTTAIFSNTATFGGTLKIPYATSPSTASAGLVAINTTTASSGIAYSDGTARRLYDLRPFTYTFGSSTIAAYGGLSAATTTFRYGDGATWMDFIICGTGTSTPLFSDSNGLNDDDGSIANATIWTQNKGRYVEIGTSATATIPIGIATRNQTVTHLQCFTVGTNVTVTGLMREAD